MTDDLNKLVEIARRVTMSERDKEDQRRSFAYGNTAFENADITRDMVDREAERLRRETAHERR